MQVYSLPMVNAEFETKQGDTFTVIGRGTQGIIIEYSDGRVELISPSQWANMHQSAIAPALH